MSLLDGTRFCTPYDVRVLDIFFPELQVYVGTDSAAFSYPIEEGPLSNSAKIIGRVTYQEGFDLGFQNIHLTIEEDSFVPAYNQIAIANVHPGTDTFAHNLGIYEIPLPPSTTFWSTPMTITFEGAQEE